MSGRQEVPPVTSAGSGTATLVVDAARTTITATVAFTGLTNLTEAHIHAGDVGVDGPIIFSLASGSFSSPLVVTLTAADLIPRPAQGITTFSDAVTAILEGRTYVNLHTLAFPDGEIRGQVGPASLAAQLNGSQVVPPVLTPASGSFTVTLNNDQSAMTFTLNTTGMQNVSAAQIRAANGQIIFPLATSAFDTPFTDTLSEADFAALAEEGFTSFDEAIDGMFGGLTSVDVSTLENTEGEIGGQIQSAGIVVPPPPTKPR
jgi:hypothetical protein